MILTPEQIEIELVRFRDYPAEAILGSETDAFFDTLAAYAEIVRGVAENDPSTGLEGECPYCEHYPDQVGHAPDCAYLAARKLRGLE
jgi:hypothetical protein